MNKQELVSAIAAASGLTNVASEKALNATTEAIKGALSKGESIQLIGFGTFSISDRAARTGRNPQTGKEIQINFVLHPEIMVEQKENIVLLKSKLNNFELKCNNKNVFLTIENILIYDSYNIATPSKKIAFIFQNKYRFV